MWEASPSSFSENPFQLLIAPRAHNHSTAFEGCTCIRILDAVLGQYPFDNRDPEIKPNKDVHVIQ